MTNADYERVLHLIGVIYDAATQPDLWPDFANKLCQVIPSTDSNIAAVDLIRDRVHVSFSMSPPEFLHLYFTRYHDLNPYWHRDLPFMQTGRIFKSHETCPPEEFEQTEFYREFFSKQNLFHMLSVNILKEGDIAGNLALVRAKEMGIYTNEEAHLLSLLVPHLQRAFRIGQMLEGLRLERTLLNQTLAKLPQGALIVSRAGKVVFANPSAEQVLARQDGLMLDRQGALQAAFASAHKQLRQLIENAGQPASVLPAHCGGLFQLERPSGLRPLSLLIAPLNLEISHFNYHQPSVLIFINDPEQQTEAVEERLQHLYNLTPAEAKLAIVLIRGKNVIEAAVELGVSPNTARTHLKRIFQKTGTHRQSELVNLLLNSPATLK